VSGSSADHFDREAVIEEPAPELVALIQSLSSR
jgi:hypothetical protein